MQRARLVVALGPLSPSHKDTTTMATSLDLTITSANSPSLRNGLVVAAESSGTIAAADSVVLSIGSDVTVDSIRYIMTALATALEANRIAARAASTAGLGPLLTVKVPS
ncbi:MAG: hypothetical protein KC731_10385 [Myxococcales bacterium]|nr:hypothetical protein [Myxococcales bacterium]